MEQHYNAKQVFCVKIIIVFFRALFSLIIHEINRKYCIGKRLRREKSHKSQKQMRRDNAARSR